ncbi:MAG: RraA family protein [Burkholderiaceae bacterium]
MTLKQRYERLYAGLVYDAMTFDVRHPHPFVVHHAVRAAWPIGDRAVCGPAFTCRGERVREEAHVRDMVRIEMFDSFTPGCVQVIDTGGDESVAHFGDISGKLARQHGAVGAVIDGFTRDLRILEKDDFPVFCRGAQPIDAFGRWQIVEYQKPVWMPGVDGRVRVEPGDWIFADGDGVMAIPAALAERVCELAERRGEQEDEVRRRLLQSRDPVALYHEVGRW